MHARKLSKMQLKIHMFLVLFILIGSNTCCVFCQDIEEVGPRQHYNFVELIQNSAKHISVSNNLQLASAEDKTLLNEFLNILHESINPILHNFLYDSASDKCYQDLMYVFSNLKSDWAARMLDSYAKPESGLLNGNAKWLGEYDECLSVYAPASKINASLEDASKINGSLGNFKGKYCTLGVPLKIKTMSLPLNLGVCLPDSCDISGYIFRNKSLNFTDLYPTVDYKNLSLFDNITLTCKETSREYTGGAIFVMFLISLFALLAVIGSLITAYEYYFINDVSKESIYGNSASQTSLVNGDVESKSCEDIMITGRSGTNKSEWFEKCKPFFNCFCFFTNGQKILYVGSSEGQLPCLHGIRFLSMSWIILCHSYAFFCFFYNGFLVTHVYLQQAFKTDGKIPWLYFYIHRFIRLTPVYMVVLAFYTTLDSHISSGPLWPDVNVDPSCQSRWWWNILYINNFLAASEQCMGWAWYLANDMQFYVICPLFLIALWRRPVIGYSLLGVTFAASTITTFVLSYEYNLFSGLGNIVRVVDDIEDFLLRWTDYFDIIYIKPYTRISPYLVGILLAYYIYKTRQNGTFKLHKITLYLGWIVASTITLACMYGLYHRDQSRVEIAFYNSFSRTCFALGLAWVIFVCVTDQGGVVNSILSWKALIPLSRLTYSAYLVHPIVEILYFASVKQLIHFQHVTMVIYFLGFLFVSYAAALVTSLLFESPVIRLERLIRNKFTARE